MRKQKAEVRGKLRVLDGGSYVCCMEETTCVIRRELRTISETTRSTTSGIRRSEEGVIRLRQDRGGYGGVSGP